MPDAVEAPGALRGRPGPEDGPAGAIIDNRTGLPDDAVRESIMSQWVETTAGMQLAQPTAFQMYATSNQGSMLARTPFQTPGNVFDEIRLARQVADTDDDIQAVIGQSLATAFGDGMENQHPDEATLRLYNQIASGKVMNLDTTLKEIYREYLIAGQFSTVSLFTRRRLTFTPADTDEKVSAQVSVPLVGVLPAENVRVVTNDLFGTGELAYKIEDNAQKEWLEEFFGARTTPARKAKMRSEEPVMAALFTRRIEVPWNDSDMFLQGQVLYGLNPRMVHRTTMPKGAAAYPRPLLTANFALLEAKRLLNIMDYALLQGGTNYIVVAKQGTDKWPAKQPEVDNLTDQVRHASRSGVLVGDHRVSIEIITPDLSELLNAQKRKLLGRKLAMAMLRVPEQVTDEADQDAELQFIGRTVTADRRDIRRHVEGYIYEEIAERNTVFKKGSPGLWFPKIILTGVKDFYDSLIKARDRGDIPRKWAVENLGFDYEAGVAQREREKAAGHDELMVPGSVPFSPQDGPPSDTPEGRPRGSSRNNGRPGSPDQDADRNPSARPRRPARRRRAGEPVRASFDTERGQVVRVGEVTASVMEMFPGARVGRLNDMEREAIESGEVIQRGPLAIVPVNPGYEATELRPFVLEEGLRLIVGRTPEGAIVAKALSTREPHYSSGDALERAMRWGFIASLTDDGPEVEPEPDTLPTADDIAAALSSHAREAVAGLNVAGIVASVMPTLAQTFGDVVAQAVAKAMEEQRQLPSPPPPAPTA